MILVTGGTGYIGKDLVKRLKGKVRVLARNGGKENAEYFKGDIKNFKDVLNASKGADVIYHLAASKDHVASYSEIKKTNVAGTKNVFEAARINGVKKVIIASSVAATEKIKVGYSRTKTEIEKMSKEYSKYFTVPVIRIAPVYDIERIKFLKYAVPNLDLKIHLVNKKNLIDAMINAEKYGKSKIYTIADKNPINVKDVVKVIKENSTPLMLSKKKMITFVRAYEKISNMIKLKPLITEKVMSVFLQERDYDITLAQKELKYKPADTLKTIREMMK